MFCNTFEGLGLSLALPQMLGAMRKRQQDAPLLGFQAERPRRTFWCAKGKAQFIDMHSMTLGFTCNSFSDSLQLLPI